MFVANLLQEMEDRHMTMEEYFQYATEKALRNAIVYNDALTSKSDFSPEPTVSPQHVDEVNLKNETSFSNMMCSPGENPDLFSVIESVFPDSRSGVSNPMDKAY
ncbi:hypothetical protein Tco_0441791 [Tanacetum coccineum]